jgi:hypothetical protein
MLEMIIKLILMIMSLSSLETEEGFDPLNSLSAGYGSIDSPNLDAKSFSAFEGDNIQFDKPNPPSLPKPPRIIMPLMPKGLHSQVASVRKHVVGKTPGRQGANTKGLSIQEKAAKYRNYISGVSSTVQKKNYGKIYSYDAGPKSNAFFKKYYSYGADTYKKIGFNPMVNNEANWNENTSGWQNFKHMLTESFVPLFTRGFVSGPKSLAKMLDGDFTSGDLEDARIYEEASAIGMSSKKGPGAFFNNLFMNFGYTAGIMSEILAEEVVGGVLAPLTGGMSFLTATANNAKNVYRAGKGLKFAKGVENTASTVSALNKGNNAKNFWKAVHTPTGDFFNIAGNATRAYQMAKADNLTSLAKSFKTAGGFYQDVRSLNAALSESRLEAGMVQNSVYENKYNEFYNQNLDREPTNKEQEEMLLASKKAGLETLGWNMPLIYFTNKMTFGNLLNKGGIRNFVKTSTKEIMDVSSKSYGKVGRVLYDKASKKFLYEANNLKNLGKSWIKNPGFKSLGKTINYFKANFAEGFQENAQEIISRANEKFYTEAYNSPFMKSSLFTKARTDQMFNTPYSVYDKEIRNEFSMQGLETFGSGFFMGTLGGGLNTSAKFLFNNYNRIYDKEGFKEWKETKEKVTTELIEKLNDNISIKELLSNRYVNAGSQDTLSLIKENANTKQSKDIEFEAMVSQIDYHMQNGSTDFFIQKLESLRDLTNEELQEELKFDDINESERYRSKIEKTIAKVESVKKAFEIAKDNFPNPINKNTLPDPKSPDFLEAVVLENAWNLAVKNLVYVNESFKDVAVRSKQIKQTYLRNSALGQVNNSSITALFQPDDLVDNISALNMDLSTLKSGLSSSLNKESDNKKIKTLQNQIKSLNEYKTAYDKFNKFYNRAEYTDEVKEELSRNKDKDKELTAKDIQKRMSELYGKENDSDTELSIIKDLKDKHDDYLRILADSVDGNVFNTELDSAFEQLLDFYKLKKESRVLAKNIDMFSDPSNFYDVVLKNSKWMEKLYKNRKSYYKNIVIDQIHKIEENSLLNALASEGIYVSMDDFIEWQKNGTKPSEFFNNKTKSVILKDTAEYDAYYELFRRADELKEISEKVKSAEDVIKETDKTIRDKTIIVNTYESLINEKDLYNKIYKLFEINSLNNLSNEEFSNLTEEEEINLFNLFLKTSVPAKNLIDEHNKNKNLDEITKETGTIEDFDFVYKGNELNTQQYETKRAITTMINKFKADLNKLNKITEKTEKEIEEINNLTILIRDFGKLMNTKFPDTKVKTTTTTTDTKADIDISEGEAVSVYTPRKLLKARLDRIKENQEGKRKADYTAGPEGYVVFLKSDKSNENDNQGRPINVGAEVYLNEEEITEIKRIEAKRAKGFINANEKSEALQQVYRDAFKRALDTYEIVEDAEFETEVKDRRSKYNANTKSDVTVVPENAESSDDVESPAVESGQKTINTDDPNRYTVEKLKIDLEKVTNKKEYDNFLIDVFIPNIQNMIQDDVTEMTNLMNGKKNSFENLNDIKIDIKKLEKESQIVTKVDIITPNKSNFSANFTFVVTKVDDNNKVVTIKPLGSEELISLSFDDIANKFDLKETIENLTESSKETLNDEVKKYVNETNDVLDAFLVNKKQIDKIIEGVSSKKIKDIDKNLLDDLYC